jgi:hypothetical protein
MRVSRRITTSSKSRPTHRAPGVLTPAERRAILRRRAPGSAGDLDASARLREIRDRLATWVCILLEAAVGEDHSRAELSRRYCLDPKTARAWVIPAIKALRTV